MIFRSNEYITKYMYDFTIYGVIPVFLISQIKDTELVLRYFSFFSLVTFLMYCSDPLNGYAVFGDYMAFGYNFSLSAYYGLFLGRKYLNYKWMLPFEILCLLDVIIFANRSAALSIIALWIILELVYEKRTYKEKIKLTLIVLGILISIIFSKNIILYFT